MSDMAEGDLALGRSKVEARSGNGSPAVKSRIAGGKTVGRRNWGGEARGPSFPRIPSGVTRGQVTGNGEAIGGDR